MGEIQRIGAEDITVAGSGNDVELSLDLYESPVDFGDAEQVAFDAKDIGIALDRLAPLVPAAADAAAQYGQAIVRFPEGAGWHDLMGRKTPGWEEWKQLGILKDGKFQPQAAIKQAKLQPAAVANIAMQGAAMAVGMAYMAEISSQLEGIEEGIAAVQEEIRLERESKVKAAYGMLREYAATYEERAGNPEKRQAVLVAVEGIKLEARSAWEFQLACMDALGTKLSSAKAMSDEKVKDCGQDFLLRERSASAVYKVLLAAEQVGMQYEGDFSSKRIARERAEASAWLEDYSTRRSFVQAALSSRVEAMKGGMVAIPERREDDYEPQNLFLDAMHEVAVMAPMLTPLALRKEAVRKLEMDKKDLDGLAESENPLCGDAEQSDTQLAMQDFVYNKANALVIDGDSIRFIEDE